MSQILTARALGSCGIPARTGTLSNSGRAGRRSGPDRVDVDEREGTAQLDRGRFVELTAKRVT